jgi:hypothetical protein
MKTDYTPIDPDYFDIVENEILKDKLSQVFYFQKQKVLGEEKDKIEKISSVNNFEKFILMRNGNRIRMDRIITINGIPGPAYDEYDRYALACLECNVNAGN